jgi:hypothetical protein
LFLLAPGVPGNPWHFLTNISLQSVPYLHMTFSAWLWILSFLYNDKSFVFRPTLIKNGFILTNYVLKDPISE